MSGMSQALGRRVRALRALRGLTQADLAAGAGLTRETVGRIERGDVRPHRATRRALAAALSVPVERLSESGDGDALL